MSNDMGSKVKRAGTVILSFILLSMLINVVQGAPIAVSFTDTVDNSVVGECFSEHVNSFTKTDATGRPRVRMLKTYPTFPKEIPWPRDIFPFC